MTPELPLAPRSIADAAEAARIMGSNQIRRLPVTEGGKICGILSLGDLSQNEKNGIFLYGRLPHLEQIFRGTYVFYRCGSRLNIYDKQKNYYNEIYSIYDKLSPESKNQNINEFEDLLEIINKYK